MMMAEGRKQKGIMMKPIIQQLIDMKVVGHGLALAVAIEMH